jgi:photosystem II stability/assembly factor-like uncharacterized protein
MILYCTSEAQWTPVSVPQTKGTSYLDIETPNDSTVWATIFNSKYFVKTSNGGATWIFDSIASAPSNYNISNFAAIDADTCYALMNYMPGGLYKTIDGGKTWIQTGVGQLFNSNSFPDFVHFWGSQKGVIVCDPNSSFGVSFEIYTTSDGGVTWNRVPQTNIPFTNSYGAITNSYCVSGNKIWFLALGRHYQLYSSSDFGVHWQANDIKQINAPGDTTYATNPSAFGFVFLDSLRGILGANSDTLWRTNDGGVTWAGPISAPASFHPGYLAKVPGTSNILSNSLGSSYSSDFGNTWITIDNLNHATYTRFFNQLVGWNGGATMYKWNSSVLPVKIISFTATGQKDRVMLQWSTAMEMNSKDFEVQRSLDGIHFETIATVNAAGNSNSTRNYSFDDFQSITLKGNVVFFRIVETDIDGHLFYTDVKKVKIADGKNKFTLLYNPVRNEAVLNYECVEKDEVLIRVLDHLGRVVINKEVQVMAGTNPIQLQTGNLAKGIYEVELTNNKNQGVVRMMKE